MKLPRRKFLHLAAGIAALPAVSRVARAQTYPSRPVRLFEGFGGGSTADIGARLIGRWLSERLHEPLSWLGLEAHIEGAGRPHLDSEHFRFAPRTCGPPAAGWRCRGDGAGNKWRYERVCSADGIALSGGLPWLSRAT